MIKAGGSVRGGRRRNRWLVAACLSLVLPLSGCAGSGAADRVGHQRPAGAAARIVEIHVPLVPGADRLLWIEQVEDFLIGLEEPGKVEVFDESEECGDDYVFFITGADEATLLAVASRMATLDGVPSGAFALITDEGADEICTGRRVSLPPR